MAAVVEVGDDGRNGAGRREQRKLATRAELLAAGRKLFSERGLYEARVEDLTATAGIAKGTLYQYFRDKDELVLAVVAQGFSELQRAVDARAAERCDFAGRAGRIAEAHAVFFTENPDLMRIFHQVRGLLKFNARRWGALRRVMQQHVERLAAHLGRAPAPADLTAARRRELAAALFGAVSGMASVRAALDQGERSSLRPAVARRVGAAMARTWTGMAVLRAEPALNARVAAQRRRRDARAARGNDAKTPDGGAG